MEPKKNFNELSDEMLDKVIGGVDQPGVLHAIGDMCKTDIKGSMEGLSTSRDGYSTVIGAIDIPFDGNCPPADEPNAN